MKVMLTGGGTGGHIYPAIAIADKIKQEDPTGSILFVGTRRGKESELVPQSGYPIEFLHVSGFDRKNILRNVKVILEYNTALREADKIIEKFQPDVVIGTGGYVSAPLIKAAAKRGIRTFIQEQNAIPGLTNKLLEKDVEKVFLGFQEGSAGFKDPQKHIYTGNPVRKAFYSADQKSCREYLKLDPDAFVILAFGGSQGAGRINKAMVDVVDRYNGMPGIIVIFVPGKYYHLPVMTELLEKEIQLADNIRILEYIDDMAHYLPAADLIISRSGALTVSEIAVSGRPAILIPSPIVTGDHQLFNANVLGNRGGAVVIEEKNLTDEGLLHEIQKLMNDKNRLEEMGKRSREAASKEATSIIWETIKK
jgi:UDP-N-acetylglucosamine--N-acetylmuramyl-(pentapeptide) pyrophosphoryl-undecaprenol N-acetylglucosamine transferase